MNDIEVKEIRKSLGLTQVEFAKKLGVDTKTVQNWESGKNIPSSKHEIIRSLKPRQYYGGNNQKNINGDNINGNKVTATSPEMEKMLEILATSEQSLAKAQEHITSLLEIIRDLTNKV